MSELKEKLEQLENEASLALRQADSTEQVEALRLKWLGKKEYDLLEKRSKTTYPQSSAIVDCMILLGKPPTQN